MRPTTRAGLERWVNWSFVENVIRSRDRRGPLAEANRSAAQQLLQFAVAVWVYIVEECRGPNFVKVAGRVRVDRSIAPEEIEVSWNYRYANKSLRVRFRHTAENPLGNRILEQNLVDHIACIPAPDIPNIWQEDELAIIPPVSGG